MADPIPSLTRLSPLATVSTHDAVLAIDLDLVRLKARHARDSEQGREIHVIHDGDGDVLQRMLNAVQPGTYVTPHRHLHPPKSEALVLLQGALAFVAFHDDGTLDESRCVILAPTRNVIAMDCRPGVWHTILALEPDTVVFEVKPGPYDASDDKSFAEWAPREGAADAPAYLAKLEDEVRRRFELGARGWSA